MWIRTKNRRRAVGAVPALALAAGVLSSPWAVLSAEARPGKCGCMDVVLVIDDTGSMDGAIDNVKAGLVSIIGAARVASRGDLRMGLVSFNDTTEVDQPFTASQADLTAAVNALIATGGGGEPEASDDALNYVVSGASACGVVEPLGPLGAFRDECVKIAVLVTDARPAGSLNVTGNNNHCNDSYEAADDDADAHQVALNALAADPILISAVFVPTTFCPACHPAARAVMMDYADTTGGVFTEVAADGDGTADAITSIIEACGGVEPDCGDFPCGNNDNKVQLCHVPPGNPDNEQTLCISPNAVDAHLANHEGDHCGPCEDDDDSDDDGAPLRLLTVQSNASGAFIDLTPTGSNNEGGGLTPFERFYQIGTVISLTAPKTHAGRNFLGWEVDGLALGGWYAGTTLALPVVGAYTIEAIYSSPPAEPGGRR